MLSNPTSEYDNTINQRVLYSIIAVGNVVHSTVFCCIPLKYTKFYVGLKAASYTRHISDIIYTMLLYVQQQSVL